MSHTAEPSEMTEDFRNLMVGHGRPGYEDLARLSEALDAQAATLDLLLRAVRLLLVSHSDEADYDPVAMGALRQEIDAARGEG